MATHDSNLRVCLHRIVVLTVALLNSHFTLSDHCNCIVFFSLFFFFFFLVSVPHVRVIFIRLNPFSTLFVLLNFCTESAMVVSSNHIKHITNTVFRFLLVSWQYTFVLFLVLSFLMSLNWCRTVISTAFSRVQTMENRGNFYKINSFFDDKYFFTDRMTCGGQLLKWWFCIFLTKQQRSKIAFFVISGNEKDEKKNRKGKKREQISILPEFHDII